jgi:hypothetical protein
MADVEPISGVLGTAAIGVTTRLLDSPIRHDLRGTVRLRRHKRSKRIATWPIYWPVVAAL